MPEEGLVRLGPPGPVVSDPGCTALAGRAVAKVAESGGPGDLRGKLPRPSTRREASSRAGALIPCDEGRRCGGQSVPEVSV